MAKKKKKTAKAKSPKTGSLEPKKAQSEEAFDDVDAFFFGSETGAFTRDEFDYDPFDDHTGKHAALDEDLPPPSEEQTRVAMNVSSEIRELLAKETASGQPEDVPEAASSAAEDDFFGSFDTSDAADEPPPAAQTSDELTPVDEDPDEHRTVLGMPAQAVTGEVPPVAVESIDEDAADLPDFGDATDLPEDDVAGAETLALGTPVLAAELPDELKSGEEEGPLPTAPAPSEPRRGIEGAATASAELLSAEMPALTEEDVAHASEWAELIAELSAECEGMSGSADAAGRASYLYELGRMLGRKAGDWSAARAKFQEALGVEPGYLPARRALVQLMIGKQDWPTAAAQLDKLVEQATGDGEKVSVLVESARILMDHVGDLEGAVARLGRAGDLLPGNYAVSRFLREALWRKEAWGDAADLAKTMSDELVGGERVRASWELGRICDEKLDDSARAVEGFRAALEADGLFMPALLELERLLRLSNDQAGLAAAWRESASSWAPADSAFWFARAAREGDSADLAPDVVEADYRAAIAVSPAPEILAEEFRQWLEFRERYDDLAELVEESLRSETDPRQRAMLLCLGGQVEFHHRGDHVAADEAFRRALEADSSCTEAAEGRRKVLKAQGDWAGMIQLLQARLRSASDNRVRVALHVKIAEIAAFELDDGELAKTEFEEAIALEPNSLLLLDSLARAAIFVGDHAAAAERLEQTASVVEEGGMISAYLRRAARHWMAAGNSERAVSAIKRALTDRQEDLLIREELSEAYRAGGHWSEAAAVLREAGSATDDRALRNVLLYRSAQLSVRRAGDADAAEACYREILDTDPGFLAASMDLQDLYADSGEHESLGRLQRLEAENCTDPALRSWLHLDAGRSFERANLGDEALADYHAALSGYEHCPVTNAALRRIYRKKRTVDPLLVSYGRQLEGETDLARQAALRIQRVAVLHAKGEAAALEAEVDELLSLPNLERLPLASMGAVCEAVQAPAAALSLYRTVADNESFPAAMRASCLFQAGLILEEVEELEDLEAAVASYERSHELNPRGGMAFEGLERVHSVLESWTELASVFAREANAAEDSSVGAFYALQAAELYERTGDTAAAGEAYCSALTDPASRDWAYEGAVRLGVAGRNESLLERATDLAAEAASEADQLDRRMTLGERLVHLEHYDGALRAYAKVLELQPSFLPAAYHMEFLHRQAQSWEAALEAQETIASLSRTDKAREGAEARSELLLAERGVTSDKAFDFYQRVHLEDPSNVAALRGLGGIHLSREDYDKAAGFFASLEEHASDSSVRAEALAQQAAILLKRGDDRVEAQSKLEQALELDARSRLAIQSLRGLYSEDGNWQSLVGVIARESMLSPPEQRLPFFAEIARVWEEKLGNPKVAVSSWKKVLAEDPGHAEATERLLSLHEAAGDWSAYLDVAEYRLKDLSGDELRERQAELGALAAEKAGDDARAVRLLRSAVSGDNPPMAALASLSDIARARGEWEQLLGTLERRIALEDSDATRLALLDEIARVQLDQLMDRNAAAENYRRALALDPDYSPALSFFVDFLYDGERWGEARPLFERYAKIVEAGSVEDDEDRLAITGFHYKHGVVLNSLGEGAEAVGCFQAALGITPNHLPSLEAGFPLFVASGDWEGAQRTGRAILGLRGDAGDAAAVTELHLGLGQAELELGNSPAALKSFKKAIEKTPNDVRALQGLARVHRGAGDWNSMLSTYNSIIKYSKEPAQAVAAYLTKGDVLDCELGFTDKAVLHFEKILMIDKTNFGAAARLAQIAASRGDTERATAFADRARGAARSEPERVQSELLSRICSADGSVDAASLIEGVEGGGDVLSTFRKAIGDSGEVSRADAARAFRATLPRP